MKPLGKRLIVTSRGTAQTGSIVLPEQYLRDSNVCKTDDGRVVICRDNAGYEMGDRRRIVLAQDVIAEIVNKSIVPLDKWVLVRKCVDAEDESGIITSETRNSNQWAEILAVGSETRLDEYIGWLVLVHEIDYDLQKVEETEADWLVNEASLLMVTEPEE